jgi:hypothetical protein
MTLETSGNTQEKHIQIYEAGNRVELSINELVRLLGKVQGTMREEQVKEELPIEQPMSLVRFLDNEPTRLNDLSERLSKLISELNSLLFSSEYCKQP